MKKSTVWILVVIIVLLLAVGWYAFSISDIPNSASTAGGTGINNSSSSSSIAQTIDYFCDKGTIDATYASGSVSLAISDGRSITLAQTESGSGVRYQTQIGADGMPQQIVFQGEGNNAFLTEDNKTTYNNCVAGTETSSTSGTALYTDGSKLFSFAYPTQFSLSGGEMGYTQNWRSEATSSGLEFVVVTIPSSLEPKTNFVDAKFTFGTSADPGAVSGCLTDAGGEPVTATTTTINGVSFTKLTFSDVGAGNIYQITSYRTVRDNQCYAADYVIHSGNIANYPQSAGVKAFDMNSVQTVLDAMARSLRFL